MEWLIAFFVHSTLWCGLAWLWLRLRPKTHARLRETIWYTAIAASLITPTAQALSSQDSAFWHLTVPALIASSAENGVAEHGAGHEEAIASTTSQREAGHGDEGAVASAWSGFASWSWLAIAGGLVLCNFVRLEGLRRRIQRRKAVQDPRATRALEELSRTGGLSATPRLTECDLLGSPVALGFGSRREICVPVRALHELDEDELSALLGHEVAHHLRGDTVRLALLNTLQAVFFFQPFFRLAMRGIHLATEEQCDEWAANQLEDHFAMASCLTQVAGWVVRQDRRLPVPCMGRRRSQLEVRVHRLVDEHNLLRAPREAWRHLGSAGLLVIATWFAPRDRFQ